MDREDRIHVTFHKPGKDGKRNKMEGMVSINTDTYTNPFCQKMSKIEGSALPQPGSDSEGESSYTVCIVDQAS